MTVAAIVQPNYIPWKGYFDLIRQCDVFILLDDVQYTRRDWRNRNLIKTPKGLHWLSIPVSVKGNYTAPINAIRCAEDDWPRRHWQTLRHHYRQAHCFREMEEVIASWYRICPHPKLSDINRHFLERVCIFLGIGTPLVDSSNLGVIETDPNLRLIKLCQAVGATRYLSGPSARSYLNAETFQSHGIAVDYFVYGPYPVYPQPHGTFAHNVSILDTLLCTGSQAARYVTSLPAVRL